MTAAMATVLAGLGSVLITATTTIWLRRRSGPEAQAAIVTASTLLLAQLQTRIAALEGRVKLLERENLIHETRLRHYEDLYGPLPATVHIINPTTEGEHNASD